MAIRIDQLRPGTVVVLGFKDYQDRATFLGIADEGDERRASFRELLGRSDETFDWEAYRYQGHWAYGTSADYLRLAEVVPCETCAGVNRHEHGCPETPHVCPSCKHATVKYRSEASYLGTEDWYECTKCDHKFSVEREEEEREARNASPASDASYMPHMDRHSAAYLSTWPTPCDNPERDHPGFPCRHCVA